MKEQPVTPHPPQAGEQQKPHPARAVLKKIRHLQKYAEALQEHPPGIRKHQEQLEEEIATAQKVLHAAELYISTIAAIIEQECDPELEGKALNARMGGYRDETTLLAAFLQIKYTTAQQYVHNGRMLADTRAIHTAKENGHTPPAKTLRSQGLQQVADQYKAGKITTAQTHAITKALTSKHYELDIPAQQEIAQSLLSEAQGMGVTKLDKRAQHLAATHGATTPQERDHAFRKRRYVKIGPLEDGLHRIYGLVTPEFAAEFTNITDHATNPRNINRTLEGKTREQRYEIKAMTPGQRMHDALLEQMGNRNNTNVNTTTGRPAIIVIVREKDLGTTTGEAYQDHTPIPIPVQTAERTLCNQGGQEIIFNDANDVLRMGRTLRTFTQKQRQALAARDGGCKWPDCEARLSWAEAHHIIEWRNGGRTDLENGILLCLEHHTTLHDRGYRILKWKEMSPEQQRRAEKQLLSKPKLPIMHWLQRPIDHPQHANLIPMPGRTPWLVQSERAIA